MIISRTPLRISFFGGGTDYPDYYNQYGGEVLSTTINQYIYITINRLNPFFDHCIHIGYSQSELVREVGEIKHPSVKACLNYLSITKDVEIFAMSDLPARTGLGSSSAFTVGLLHALHAFQHDLVSKDRLAREAIHIEQAVIQERVGSQDQVAASIGGLNHICFNKQSVYRAEPLPFDPIRKNMLNDHLLLFFTSISRSAHEILEEQVKNLPSNLSSLNLMKQQVQEAIEILSSPGRDLHEFGELLHQGWQLKRSLSKRISNQLIDDMYDTARRDGAIGGKLLGAGGGGFLLLFAPPEKHNQIKAGLSGLLHVPFSFETEGTRLVYFS